jgi:hypothetical protein
MFGFGKRRVKDGDATTTRKGPHVGNGRNFHLGTWLRLHGVDIITMLFAGCAGLGIYFAREFILLNDCTVLTTVV